MPWSQEAPLLHGHITGHLDYPRLIGMGCHASHMDFPTAQVDEEEDVVGYQSAQCPHFGGEEISRHQHLHVRADELLPRRGLFTLRCWGNIVSLQDVADGLITNRIAQVGQRADDPIISPRSGFPGPYGPPRPLELGQFLGALGTVAG
jgi:hypothetical protein